MKFSNKVKVLPPLSERITLESSLTARDNIWYLRFFPSLLVIVDLFGSFPKWKIERDTEKYREISIEKDIK